MVIKMIYVQVILQHNLQVSSVDGNEAVKDSYDRNCVASILCVGMIATDMKLSGLLFYTFGLCS